MKALVHLCAAVLLFPTLGMAESPVDLEFSPDPQEVERVSSEAALREASGRAEKVNAFSLRVRSVKVQGCWGKDVQLPLAVGDVLTSDKISAAMEALRHTISD